MFAKLKQRQPGGTVVGILYRGCIRGFFAIWLRVFYRLRVIGVENLPQEGPMLLISNHQSFLDPLVLGTGAWRRRMFWTLARSSLFKNPIFAALIGSMNARPVERGEADLHAMRGAIDLLKADQGLLLFAEGTRCDDGKTAPFKSGLMLLVRRSKAAVVPAAIDGAFDVWPRNRKRPRLTGQVSVQFGEPIPAAELLAMDAEDAVELLRDRVETMRKALHQQRTSGL